MGRKKERSLVRRFIVVGVSGGFLGTEEGMITSIFPRVVFVTTVFTCPHGEAYLLKVLGHSHLLVTTIVTPTTVLSRDVGNTNHTGTLVGSTPEGVITGLIDDDIEFFTGHHSQTVM